MKEVKLSAQSNRNITDENSNIQHFFVTEGIAQENGTPKNRQISSRKVFDKKNSEIIADIMATPEQKEKKKIRKMKINKKVPLGKTKRQSAQLSSLLILPKP